MVQEIVKYHYFSTNGSKKVKVDSANQSKTFPYSGTSERYMKMFYENLNEKDKRHYAAVEAQKLSHGGISYVAEILGCARSTIHDGIEELKKTIS